MENDGEFVSRTKKKQAVEELQKLGAALVNLPPVQLESLALPDVLLKAVLDAQRITSHEARRRQIQYIGKVMRKVDPEPVRAALAAVDGKSAAARAQQRRLESWRERLIGDDEALTEYAGDASGRRPAGAAHADPQRAQGNRRKQAPASATRAVQGVAGVFR